MVFYRVIGPLGEYFGHFGPFTSVEQIQQVQEPFLMSRPFGLINIGVKMIMPPLPTLFTHPVRNKLRNKRPSLRPILVNHVHQRPVFLFSPLFFSKHQSCIVAVKGDLFSVVRLFVGDDLMVGLHVVLLVGLGRLRWVVELHRLIVRTKRFYYFLG